MAASAFFSGAEYMFAFFDRVMTSLIPPICWLTYSRFSDPLLWRFTTLLQPRGRCAALRLCQRRVVYFNHYEVGYADKWIIHKMYGRGGLYIRLDGIELCFHRWETDVEIPSAGSVPSLTSTTLTVSAASSMLTLIMLLCKRLSFKGAGVYPYTVLVQVYVIQNRS